MRHLLLGCRCGRVFAEHVEKTPRAICPECGGKARVLSTPFAIVMKGRNNARPKSRPAKNAARLEALLKRAYLRLKPTSRAFDAKSWAKRIARRIVKLR